MRRHSSESHSGVAVDALGISCHQVKLQTFFRGTRRRYFEVDAGSAADVTDTAAFTNVDDVTEDEETGEMQEVASISILPPL